MEPTTEERHDGRGCDPGSGPRPDGVETEDKADPYEIGKRPLKVNKVSKVSKSLRERTQSTDSGATTRVPVLESNVMSGSEKIRSRGQWSHIVS